MTFKKGQRVWWDDPIHEKTGEYDVLAVEQTRNMVQIGNGKGTFEVLPEYLTIICPVSDEERQQLDNLLQHFRAQEKELLELMRGIVSRFDDGEFSVGGHSVQVCDEDHDSCCVYGFSVKDGDLYALLEYDSGELYGDSREVLVENLQVWSFFEAFCELIGEI